MSPCVVSALIANRFATLSMTTKNVVWDLTNGRMYEPVQKTLRIKENIQESRNSRLLSLFGLLFVLSLLDLLLVISG